VKRTDKEKRLASQFITRFLEFFPLLHEEALDAMLDLCEDDDLSVRPSQFSSQLNYLSKWLSLPWLIDLVLVWFVDSKAGGEGSDHSMQKDFHVCSQDCGRVCSTFADHGPCGAKWDPELSHLHFPH